MIENVVTLTHVTDKKPIPVNVGEQSIETLLTAHFADQNALVVAWLDYAVLIGRWEQQAFLFYNGDTLKDKHLQKLRVFNEERELHLWRSQGALKGRLRQDRTCEEGQEVVVAHQALFGTRKGLRCDERFTELTEDRGTALVLPVTNLPFDARGNLPKNYRACIKTYNYIGELENTGQATYKDCRFVGFSDGEQDLDCSARALT